MKLEEYQKIVEWKTDDHARYVMRMEDAIDNFLNSDAYKDLIRGEWDMKEYVDKLVKVGVDFSIFQNAKASAKALKQIQKLLRNVGQEKVMKLTKSKLKEIIKEEMLNEVGTNVSKNPFRAWSEHGIMIMKLRRDALWAMKAIPHKKKEIKAIEKYTQELYKLIEIIKGQAIDL